MKYHLAYKEWKAVKVMKIIIAGGRDFSDYELLKEKCDYYLQNHSEIEIVSGTAKGADSLGEKYAAERDYPIKRFPAEWQRLGRGAGHIRNAQMADYADVCIIFWDGKSKGTKNMIKIANKRGLKIKIINY